jgi:labile enterotoxin output A
MQNTIKEFEIKREKSLNLLKELKDFLIKGKKLDIEIEDKMLKKTESSLKEVESEKLKVALIGGFSEGKTSIASAWLEKYDKSSMKISQQESSNEVRVYDVDDKIELIDTPGLFGFKETEDKKEKYKEITKKYVSEAHIIIYVMNSTNPIKESHREDLMWLFRTLDLLSRTIFVLSRFDEIADVEDENDYEYNLNIKKQNITQRLQNMINLNSDEIKNLLIVGISANPFDQGIKEYWLNNLDEYKKLSKIETLQNATFEIIEKNNGLSSIILKTEKAIITDIMEKEAPELNLKNKELEKNLRGIEDINLKLESKLKKVENKIIKVKENLKIFILKYYTKLLTQNEGTELETFNDFYQAEIGKDGIIISEKVKTEFERQINTVAIELNNIKLEMNAEIKNFNTVLNSLGKDGINFIVKGNFINNAAILGVRDGIVNVGKFFGRDIGKFLKFKPWGAIKLAKGLNGLLVGVGFIMEARDQLDKYKQRQKFNKNKMEIKKFFEEQREELIKQIDSTEFYQTYFSDYDILKEELLKSKEKTNELKNYKIEFDKWFKQGEKIMLELNKL